MKLPRTQLFVLTAALPFRRKRPPYGDGYQNYGDSSYQNQYEFQQTQSVSGFADRPVGVGAWIGVALLSLFPVINLVMFFVWAFSGSTKKSLKNYAVAQLVLTAVLLAVAVSAIIIICAMGVDILSVLGFSKHYYH